MSTTSESTYVNPLHPSVASKLTPQFSEIYNKYQAPKLQAHHVSYEVYNADRGTYTFNIADGPRPAVGKEVIYKVPVTNPDGEIQVQVFTPTAEAIASAGSANAEGRLPCHVDIHGGGFVIGSLNSHGSWCRVACQALGAVVLNVDYRMAPEFPHPVPATDCYAAFKWALANAAELNIDSARISNGGASAGGNLAAVSAIMARDDPKVKHNLVLQALLVPCIDARYIPIEGGSENLAPDNPYESYEACEFAPCLPLARMVWFYRLWLGTDVDQHNKLANTWTASPIIADSHAGLAPAFIAVAEIDPLASEAQAYHKVLTKAGVESKIKIYPGVGHPFAHWDGELEAAREYVRDTLAALGQAYGLKGKVGTVEYE